MGFLRAIFGNREERAVSESRRLNALETRVEQLELDAGERQIRVLEVMDKAIRALESRERMQKRREAEAGVPGEGDGGDERAPVGTPRPSSANLARRFRRF